jgi:hypothetical protein
MPACPRAELADRLWLAQESLPKVAVLLHSVTEIVNLCFNILESLPSLAFQAKPPW